MCVRTATTIHREFSPYTHFDLGLQNSLQYFLRAFLVLETLLIAVFVVLEIRLFYVFFESLLIRVFLIVGIWGGSATRVRAAFLLFLYTLFFSLFMLLAS
jgi:NADH-ubiquinone oxidoreductase chain 4